MRRAMNLIHGDSCDKFGDALLVDPRMILEVFEQHFQTAVADPTLRRVNCGCTDSHHLLLASWFQLTLKNIILNVSLFNFPIEKSRNIFSIFGYLYHVHGSNGQLEYPLVLN